MKTLSHREKVLIYILLLLGICVFGWFALVQPSLVKQRSLNKEFQTITNSIESLKINKKDYSTLQEDSKVAVDEFNNLVKRYYDATLSSTEDVDSLFTKMTKDNKLTPLNLDIKLTVSKPIIPFKEEIDEEGKSSIAEYNLKVFEEEEQKEFIKDKKLNCYEVTQRVRGTSNDIYTYIDKINEDEGIHLSSMVSVESLSKKGQYEATLIFYVYVIFK